MMTLGTVCGPSVRFGVSFLWQVTHCIPRSYSCGKDNSDLQVV